MEERDLNCSEEKSYCLTMGDFATKVTKILRLYKFWLSIYVFLSINYPNIIVSKDIMGFISIGITECYLVKEITSSLPAESCTLLSGWPLG